MRPAAKPDVVDRIMPRIVLRLSSLRRCLALTIFAAALALPAVARAQVVVVANGSPITVYDIDQRSRLIEVMTHKKPTRQDVVRRLIDERLEIAKAKSYGLVITQDQVDKAYDSIAERQHIPLKQFDEFLKRSGIDPTTLKARLRAQLAWGELVRGKFKASLQVSEADVSQALRARGAEDSQGYVYTLYPVTVVVPSGSSAAIMEGKRREAEALRTKFVNCKDGLAYARALRDVAVREPVTRSSSEFPSELRAVLNKIEIGHLSEPDITAQGLQMFAVCGKKPTKTASPIEAQVRNEIFAKRFDTQSKQYLQQIRQKGMIEYKDDRYKGLK